jgi:hypothetical protein
MATDVRLPTHKIVQPDKDRFLNEENPFEAMMSRFDRAAELLDLEPGLYKILRHPRSRSSSRFRSDDNGDIEVFTGYRVLHNTSRGPAKGGIRFDLQRDARRGEGARRVDDVEVRGREHSVRRREGRRGLRSAQAQRRRARAPHPPVHGRHHDTLLGPTPTCPRPM